MGHFMKSCNTGALQMAKLLAHQTMIVIAARESAVYDGDIHRFIRFHAIIEPNLVHPRGESSATVYAAEAIVHQLSVGGGLDAPD
ncbi:MAG: hypothetical protein Fur005_47100 [Roseiflexaceae bacterium]